MQSRVEKSTNQHFMKRVIDSVLGDLGRDGEAAAPINLGTTRGVAIHIAHVNKSFADNHVLKDVSLDIAPGETFSIIGPSGTGKSLLLKMLINLETPDSGDIVIDDCPVVAPEMPGTERNYRSSMVFQSSALFNSLTVAENVGLWLREKQVCPEGEIQEIIAEKLRLVGLDGTETMRTSELSGGMKKRVAIARSLAMNPDLILYDEPTAELDPISADDLADTILKVKGSMENTTVIVTHDLNFALYISDRLAMIHDGRIIATGTPAAIKASSNPLVRNFVYTTTKGIKEE